MNSRRLRWSLPVLLLPLLAGCEHTMAGTEPASTFGEANRQTMMAQVIDPDPQYEYLDPATSAERAGKAVDRYRKGTVKRPERVRTTTEVSGGGSN